MLLGHPSIISPDRPIVIHQGENKHVTFRTLELMGSSVRGSAQGEVAERAAFVPHSPSMACFS